MRIALVAPRYWPDIGGVETHVEQIATRLAAAGCEVTVLTHRTARARAPRDERDGVRIERCPQWSPAEAYPVSPALVRALRARRGRDDIVHAHSHHAPCGVAALAARARPLVFTPHYHGTGHTLFARALHVPYRPVAARVFAAAARVICVSGVEAALVGTDFPQAAARIRVIPNGVDGAALRAAAPFADAPDAVVLTVGRLEPYKDVDCAIEALRHLPPDHVLHVIGEGPARADLEQRAVHLGVADRVRFLGRVSDGDLARWLRTAHTVVSMSRHEAFGLAVYEGAAAGAGVVASDIPAHREAAEALDGRVTLVAPQASGQQLAGAILASRRDDDAAVDVAGWDDVAARTLDLYREVAAAG